VFHRASVIALSLIAVAALAAPVDAATPEALVNIYRCASYDNGSESVPGNTDVVVHWSWVAKTQKEVHQYLKALTLTTTINGVKIANAKSYFSPLFYDAVSQPKGWSSVWTYNAGVISSGGQKVFRVTETLSRSVSDGWDTYPAGKNTFICTVVA
jgi:hypothetical protein